MRLIVGALLVVEGLATGLRFARFVSVLVVYPPLTIALLVGRAGIGALLFTGGLMLLQRRPAGPTLAGAGLFASAALATLEIGLALAPSSIFPAYRWPAVAAYWVYALGAAWWVRRSPRR